MNHPTPMQFFLGTILLPITLSGCAASQSSPSTPASQPSGSPASSSASPEPASTPTPSSSAQPQTRKAAAAAFQTWVAQYNAEAWDKHYATLVNAQRKLISAKKYAACRNKKSLPTFKWIRTVSTKANVKTTIPGTSKRVPATRVTVRLRMSGSVTVPITVHMFYEDGEWRWSMTKENLAGCKG